MSKRNHSFLLGCLLVAVWGVVPTVEARTPVPLRHLTVANPNPRIGHANRHTLGSRSLTATGNRRFGRVVIVALGGVGWPQMAQITASPAVLPGLNRLLEEGSLAAAQLSAAPRSNAAVLTLTQQRARISPALLRAAATINSGTGQDLGEVPATTALTLPGDGILSGAAPTFEAARAGIIYSRRTGDPVSGKKTTLYNLGWGEYLQQQQTASDPEESLPRPGALGEAVHHIGGATFSIGNADTTLGSLLPLREWSLVAADNRGQVEAGDLTAGLLQQDDTAPFGLRHNVKAVQAALTKALAHPRSALVVAEWGDCRRAALYGPWCAPAQAEAHARAALGSADVMVRRLLTTLQDPRDRLIVLAVPDLDTTYAQWLPLVIWRPGRIGKGALLQTRGQAPGVVPLEALFTTCLQRWNLPLQRDYPPELMEAGRPAAARLRLSRLIAFQAGLSWMQDVRQGIHVGWMACLIAALCLSLLFLHTTVPSGRGLGLARFCWIFTLVVPVACWLAGLCLEITWRFGSFDSSGAFLNAALLVALLAFAAVVVGTALLTYRWFLRARLRQVEAGLSLLLMTLLGWLIGGFGLPWNMLLSPRPAGWFFSPAGGSNGLILMLLGATLAGTAGLAQPSETQPQPPGRRVRNMRPVALWLLVTLLVTFLCAPASSLSFWLVCLLLFGTYWLRLWMEGHHRDQRRRHRQVTGVILLCVALVLILQRGSPLSTQDIAHWWRGWLLSWAEWWWGLASVTVIAAGLLLATFLRPQVREALQAGFPNRAMLTALSIVALPALLLLGPSGPVLMTLYPLASLFLRLLHARTHLPVAADV